jgi:glycerate-2-kinase
VTTALTGEARDVGVSMANYAVACRESAHTPAQEVFPRTAFVYAGETTVTVTGSGIGGRNQELVLAAALALEGVSGITITSVGTDGIDGPTDAAGAWANGDTITRARAVGLDPVHALADNDAYPFLKDVNALVVTGPTGTNVMDLVVVTIEPKKRTRT